MTNGVEAARPRLLIEDWLPAAAIGVECIRERSTGQQPPDKRLHVWWARRPLAASRAAVLASVLPASFPREIFERLMGFGRSGEELVAIRELMNTGHRVEGGFGVPRAFKTGLRAKDLQAAFTATEAAWGKLPTIIDPMAGGGAIPLESVRLGFRTLANEYNPVASSVLETTLDYPFRFGPHLTDRARHWGRAWTQRVSERLSRFFPAEPTERVQAYIFARTVPCPDTGHQTPLVGDWHVLKPKSGTRICAVPIVDRQAGTWTTEIRKVGIGPAAIASAPPRTYGKGGGTSLFTSSPQPISAEWIQRKAQAGEMGSTLYAVAIKSPQGLTFRPPTQLDLDALAAAETQLLQWRGDWEARNIIPTEAIPEGAKTREPLARGIRRWADMFSPRQLLVFGVLTEELNALRASIIASEGEEVGEAVAHILAFAINKFANYNSVLASWHVSHQVIRGVFDRHDFSFKSTFTEMAPVNAGSGLTWAIGSVIDAYDELSRLPRAADARPAEATQGSATALVHLADESLEAVVVDPPYSDNVQYSELADFFYVWLKRAQVHRKPEWFMAPLCENDQEAVKNDARFRPQFKTAKEAAAAAQAHYQRLMTEAFSEAHRVLRRDGVLTVMFTHKKQEAWEALFASLIEAGFTITATWPVKTESEHSLHQAKKNAAQSTVILVARVRAAHAGKGYFDSKMAADIRNAATSAAERLASEGLNPVDQLVGSFGPAMEVFSAYDSVETDTGDPVSVGQAIDIAADAVAEWRIRKLARGGLQGVEAEAQFALLCWATLGAAEFRFNEAKLLGHAVGMDVSALQQAGLITVSADKVKMLSAAERRRDQPLGNEEAQQLLFGWTPGNGKRVKKSDALKIHPRDPVFRTHLDKAQALALTYIEAGGDAAGIGAARSFALRQGIKAGDPTVRLIEAFLAAAPLALRRAGSSVAEQFPEFRAWHTLVEPLFGIAAPDWSDSQPDQLMLDLLSRSAGANAEFEAEQDDLSDDEADEEDGDEA